MLILDDNLMADLAEINAAVNADTTLSDDPSDFLTDRTVSVVSEEITYKELLEPSQISWSGQRIYAKKEAIIAKGYGPAGIFYALHFGEDGVYTPMLTVDISAPDKAITYIMVADNNELIEWGGDQAVTFRESPDGYWIRMTS